MQVDIHRKNVHQHLAFGQGIHYCIGAPLARLEGRIALEVLTKRLPNIHLQADEVLIYPPSIAFRGPETLYLTWDTSPVP